MGPLSKLVNNYAGINIVTSLACPEFQPRITLSKKVPVSEEFRIKCDKFYLDFFGQERVSYIMDMSALRFDFGYGALGDFGYGALGGNPPRDMKVVMHPNNLTCLKILSKEAV